MAPGLVGALLLAVQAGTPAVAGTIRDGASGAPLSGAIVTLTDVERSTVTDDEGRYRLDAPTAGPQHLSVRRIGYEPRTVHALLPGDGVLRLDLSLPPLPVQLPTIVVRSPVVLRGVEDLEPGSVLDRGISAAALRNHPMLAEPDGFLALTGGEASAAPEAPTGLHLRGGASDHVAYLLDGIPVFSPYHAAGIFSAWNPDALERLQVEAGAPPLASADALAGAVAGTTRAPGRELRVHGALSTSQSRLTLHGPVGDAGAGFLLSLRSGFPGIVAPDDDPSYLRGRTGDVVAKVEAPAWRGRLGVLLYDSGNRLDAAASAESSGTGVNSRNRFEWDSRSAGVSWVRPVGGDGTLRLQAWNARGEAEADWSASEGIPLTLEADREDQGLLATAERTHGARLTGVGIRAERSRTFYHVSPGDEGAGARFGSRLGLASLFVRHREPVLGGVTADVAMSGTAGAGAFRLGPRAELRWAAAPSLSVSAGYARSHQFAQSLRNPESVGGGIFPADLFLGGGAAGVPVARSDRVILGGELRPFAGARLGIQGYLVRFDGLLLVAPRTGDPFTSAEFTAGSGSAKGLSLEGAVSGRWYGAIASYGLQRVRAAYGDSSYTPGYGTSHLVELGLVVFPGPTASVRLGFTGALDRRGTAVLGAFEWESCNLLDRGCEFAGSPTHDAGRPGGTRLPDYLRLDLGVRKHWHLGLGGRDVELGVFGTITNLLGRRNVLAVATDPGTGERTTIEMRPLAPLVLGLDWRF